MVRRTKPPLQIACKARAFSLGGGRGDTGIVRAAGAGPAEVYPKGTIMKRFICAAALVASAAFAEEKAAAAEKPAAPAAAPAMPAPPAEMAVEGWFAGNWACKGQQHAGPMGPEMKTASKLEMKMELAGFWLQVKGTAKAGPMKGKEMFEGFASWDGAQHVRYDFQMGALTRLTSKGWDGDKLIFEGESMRGAQKMAVRHTLTKKGDNEFGSFFEFDGKPMIEETCTRAAAAAAPAPTK
jgi:hypothetical protein